MEKEFLVKNTKPQTYYHPNLKYDKFKAYILKGGESSSQFQWFTIAKI